MPRWAWWLWVFAALATRLWSAWFEPAFLHPDALGQGLEPAFRAVFGHGQVAWEWQHGVRSWAWPAMLMPSFAVGRGFDAPAPGAGMAPWLLLARMVPLAFDLVSGWLAIRLTERLAAPTGAGFLAAGTVALLTAVHPAWVDMASQPLIDVPAATCLLGFCLALTSPASDARRSVRIGLLAAIVAMVRVQLLPGVLIGLLLHLPAVARHVRLPALAPRSALLGAVAGLVPFALLDLWTWGAPFASTLAYLQFNAGAGQTAFGVMPVDRYLDHLQLALPILWPLLLALAALSVRRAPTIAAVFAVVVLSHQLVPYRIWRALYPALWLLPVLAGVGAAALAATLHERARPRWPVVATCAAFIVASAWVARRDETLWRTTWLWNQGGAEAVELSRALNRAAVAVSAGPNVRTVLQAVLPEAAAPGHALFGHNVEIMHPLGRSDRPDPRAVQSADVWILRAGSVSPEALAERSCTAAFAPDVLVCWRRHDALPNKP